MPRFALLCLIVFVLPGPPSWAQRASEDPRFPPVSDVKAARKDEPDAFPRHQTAEDLLRALQADRPVHEVVPPISRIEKPTKAGKRQLLPEGVAVIDRLGRLTWQDSYWAFQSDDGSSIPVLPNGQLEIMAAIHRDTGGKIDFIVSGEVTVFHDKNFLLIKQTTRSKGQEAPVNSVASQAGVAADASAQDVLAALESQRPEGNKVLERESPSGARSPGRSPMMEGSLVVRRSGRLMRQAEQWYFVCDDPVSELREVRLLPNQALEIMEQSATRSQSGLLFIVSGELTQYGSENYLLVRGVTRVLDLGNLRP